jgi:crotonobetainyl-CoA:carnitine CoA-transferase CaiB-like acyl-CoA transferase
MTLAELTEAFEGFDGVWAPYQTLDELYEDEAVVANGYLPAMTAGNGQEVQLVTSPAQFDEQPVPVERAPEHGEHTEMILMDLGYDWDRITALKDAGSVL